MRIGDLLLVRARFDPVGWVIRWFTHCEYNHVAWAINDKEIIELRGRGILTTSVTRYSNKFFYNTKLLRIKEEFPDSFICEAVSYANCGKSKGNYFKLWVTYFMILLKSKKQYPRQTCSGFIAECLNVFGFSFDETKQWYNITPADMEGSDITYEVDINDN